MTLRLAVLVSGNGSNLQAILDAIASGRLDARVDLVVSSRRDARALERAAAAGVPTRVDSLRDARSRGRSRESWERELAVALNAASVDLVVLAGWMLVLGRPFLACIEPDVVNLHPALPGAFPGLHAIERAWEAARRGEVTSTGVMIHHVVEEVDAGPVIAVATVPIAADDTLDTLRQRIHTTEHALLVDTLARLACNLRTTP